MRRPEVEKHEAGRAVLREQTGESGAPKVVTFEDSPSNETRERETQEIEEHLRVLGYIE